MDMTMAMSSAFALAALLIFMMAVRFRLLAGLRHGFLVTMIAAVVGGCVVSCWLIGIWSYESAKKILNEQTISELGNIERIVGAEIQNSIQLAIGQMNVAARIVAPEMAGGISKAAADQVQRDLMINDRLQQLNIYDRRGSSVFSVSLKGGAEPIDRIAAAYGLEGRNFISDPYFSALFGKYTLHLCVPIRSAGGEIVGVLGARFNVGDLFLRIISATRFGSTGYAVLVNSDGRILAHPDAKRVNEDISSYRAVQLALKGETGSLSQENRSGAARLFCYRPVKSPGTVNPGNMALLTEIDEDEALAPLQELHRRLFFGMAVLAAVCALLAMQLARYITRPLRDLLPVVEGIRAGDFSARAGMTGRDEIAQLDGALNDMAKGLQERDKVKELFGRYVTTQVSEEVLKGQVSLGGESRQVSILFSDIRDFTAMSEQMSPHQVVGFLNDYFSEMVEAVFEQGGVLDKFIGDGMMAVFGSLGDLSDHPGRAVMAALRMRALLGKINAERSVAGKPAIRIGIGIHTDEVVVGNIGSRKRLEYTCVGDGVNTSARVETLNKQFGTTILISEATYEAVKSRFDCRLMPEAVMKGKRRTLRVYEVLSLRPAGS